MIKKDIICTVSICCQTYNHVGYIQEAIDSFLMQETDFTYEILLRDDASTDGTAKICNDYATKHPDKIRLLAYKENQFAKGVKPFVDNVKRARGKYIAVCEGDDYWTDPYKLQKQVDFLENNPDYGLVYTSAQPYIEWQEKYDLPIGEEFVDFKSTLLKNPIATLTTMFDVCLYKQFQHDIKPNSRNWKMGDYPMWLWFAKNTKVKYIDDVTAVYRVTADSASRAKDLVKQEAFLQSVLDIRLYFNKLYNAKVPKYYMYDIFYRELLENALLYNQVKSAYTYYRAITNKGVTDRITFVTNVIKIFIKKVLIAIGFSKYGMH